MITRSIKGGDHAILVAPIRVRKPEPGQKLEKIKEAAPPVLRLKAKREQLVDHADEGTEAAEQSTHDKQKQKKSPRKQRPTKSRSRDLRAEQTGDSVTREGSASATENNMEHEQTDHAIVKDQSVRGALRGAGVKKDIHQIRLEQTLEQIALAKNMSTTASPESLLGLIEIIPELPIYIKIPIKDCIAPCHVCFSYFRKRDQLIAPSQADLSTYFSTTDPEPDQTAKH